MSSYIESPFTIEQRRLQGIVNQCNQDLEDAVRQVEDQMDHMLQMEQQQKKKDQQYMNEQESVLSKLLEDIRLDKNRLQTQKNDMIVRMQVLAMQIDGFHEVNGGMELAKERHDKLMNMLMKDHISGELLIEEVEKHGKQTLHEMEQAKEKKSQERLLARNNNNTQFQIGRKGTSLHIETGISEESVHDKSPLEFFSERLHSALSSPYADRIPSLMEMKNEFDMQPEYARQEYAIKNKNRLDSYIKQFKRLESKNRSKTEKWNILVKRYKAICQLMSVEPQDELVNDPNLVNLLKDQYKKLCHQYQVRKEQQYVFQAVSSVMKRHGILMSQKSSDEIGRNMTFAIDQNANVSVASEAHKTISLEVNGIYEGNSPTLDEKRRSVITSRKFCSMMKLIEQELKEEYGVLLQDKWVEEPTEESIVMMKNVEASQDPHHYTVKKQLADTI